MPSIVSSELGPSLEPEPNRCEQSLPYSTAEQVSSKTRDYQINQQSMEFRQGHRPYMVRELK